MKVLLVSTYELGHQPLGAAGPAAALRAAGHEVEVRDVAVEGAPDDGLTGDPDAVVFSVPMHTATELALEVAGRLGARGDRPPFAFAGLYAPVVNGHPLLGPGDLLVAGDAVPALIEWLATLERHDGAAGGTWRTVVDIGRPTSSAGAPPARDLLPPLDRYARALSVRGNEPRLTASVEASRGCNHRCRHCPVAVVYRGRSRPVGIAAVLADVDQVVALGAEHISFADPDFLNRPRHALAVARALHERWGELTFDATVKVEHLLRHRELLPELAGYGLRHVVSAFESTDDAVLARLDKGHRAGDELEAVRIVRSAGVEPRPSWLPFTPWTTFDSIGSLLELSARADLVWNTDPVQYTIRLLVPRGSLLLEEGDPVFRAALTGEQQHGTASWRHADPAIDELRGSMADLVADHPAADPPEVFASLWSLARAAGVPLAPAPPEPDAELASTIHGPDRPRLSETWFCCAEPTREQLALARR